MATTINAGTATSGAAISADTTGILALQSGSTPTTAITVDTSQNVGIGVTPSAWNTFTALDINTYTSLFSSTGSTQLSGNLYYQSAYKYKTTGAASVYVQTAGTHQWYYAASGTAGASVTPTEAMRIDNSGNLLVSTTNTDPAGTSSAGTRIGSGYISSNANAFPSAAFGRYTSTGAIVNINYAGSTVGSISYNGTTTLYNATSDQRLKENIVDAGSGLEKLANVKVRSFDWKKNQEKTDFGLVAQELNEVAPEAVVAGVDKEDGSIDKPWQVDSSALVPAMIKAIQELNAKVTALEAQLAAK